ncbi:sigma-54-dependent transcriptional regulator, partial [Bacteroidota bacterium]
TTLKLFLQFEFEEVKTIGNPNRLPGLIRSENFDVILLDMNFKTGQSTGNEGIYWLKQILKNDPLTSVVLFTAYGDVELAVNTLKLGAIDFILKPWNNEKMVSTLRNAYNLRKSKVEVKKLKSRQKYLIDDIDKMFNTMAGNCEKMINVFSLIKKVSNTDVNLLICGENGTGKELVAREVHRQSLRKKEAFISVDMNALSESLFESELFGHKKGSFTNAFEDRIGRFEAASGGTLFLDEIGNLSINLQSKLLTVLENRLIYRVGDNTPIPIDIRLICATNKNIEDLISKDLFREDLLYRINTVQIFLPPLREREGDILMLTESFLKLYSIKYEKPLVRMSHEAVKKLNIYHWPGNIRELKHVIEKAVILCENNVVTPHDLNLGSSPPPVSDSLPRTLDELEKDAIINTLNKYNGNLTKTANELGIIRQTLYNKIKKFKI